MCDVGTSWPKNTKPHEFLSSLEKVTTNIGALSRESHFKIESYMEYYRLCVCVCNAIRDLPKDQPKRGENTSLR